MNDNTGYVPVKTSDVIRCCQKVIDTIHSLREEKYENLISRMLEKELWWWNLLFRFFGCKKPTIDIVECSYKNCYEASMIRVTYALQEVESLELIAAANACAENIMYVSPETVANCHITKE